MDDDVRLICIGAHSHTPPLKVLGTVPSTSTARTLTLPCVSPCQALDSSLAYAILQALVYRNDTDAATIRCDIVENKVIPYNEYRLTTYMIWCDLLHDNV